MDWFLYDNVLRHERVNTRGIDIRKSLDTRVKFGDDPTIENHFKIRLCPDFAKIFEKFSYEKTEIQRNISKFYQTFT